MTKLTVITGPMFAGKTTELIKRYNDKGGKIFKPSFDDRYGVDSVTNHDGWKVPAICLDGVGGCGQVFETHHACFDEVQFMHGANFDGDFVPFVCNLLIAGVDVTCAGLDKDFTGVMFPNMQELIDLADEHIKLFACCSQCGRPADMTYKKSGDNQLIVELGGPDKYEPRCLNCWSK